MRRETGLGDSCDVPFKRPEVGADGWFAHVPVVAAAIGWSTSNLASGDSNAILLLLRPSQAGSHVLHVAEGSTLCPPLAPSRR